MLWKNQFKARMNADKHTDVERKVVKRTGRIQKGFLYFFWAPFWFGITLLWLFSAVHDAYEFTGALRHGRCSIVEGTVSVLHEQPRSGHAAGDRIQIADKGIHL